jgi:opacity protein-like surface antigen
MFPHVMSLMVQLTLDAAATMLAIQVLDSLFFCNSVSKSPQLCGKDWTVTSNSDQLKSRFVSVCWEAKMRKFALASAAAVGIAAVITSIPTSAADIEVPPEAIAEVSPWYASLHGGIKFSEDWDDNFFKHCGEYCEKELDVTIDTDNGWRFGGSLGYMFSDIFAIEGELSYMSQDFEEFTIHEITKHGSTWDCEEEWCTQGLDGDASILTGMINLLAGVPLNGMIKPYIGAGAGVAHISLDDDFLDDSDTTFAAQAFAGVNVGITENVGVGIRGRVLHINDLEFEDDEDCDHDIDVDLIKSVEAVLSFAW